MLSWIRRRLPPAKKPPLRGPRVRRVDVPPGTGRVVGEAALFNVGGRFFATANRCLHKGAALGDGRLEGCIVACPLHGWRYDVTTGACVKNPELRLRTLAVRDDGDEVTIEP